MADFLAHPTKAQAQLAEQLARDVRRVLEAHAVAFDGGGDEPVRLTRLGVELMAEVIAKGMARAGAIL